MELEQYLSVKTSCLFSYLADHPGDPRDSLKVCLDYISKYPMDRLLVRSAARDPGSILEVAVRYMSGVHTFKQNPEGALYILDAFTDPYYDKAHRVSDIASPSSMAQAHSCAAYAHYQKFKASDALRMSIAADERHYNRRQTRELGFGQPPLTSLALAMYHANESAHLGFVSRSVLLVGMTAREIGETLSVDVAQLSERAKKHHALWRAISSRVEEIYAEERERLQSADAGPLESVCAARGCGKRSGHGIVLRACSRKCPPDMKPRYCSKECQTKDWKQHKVICKPGVAGKLPQITLGSKALELFELVNPEEDDDKQSVDNESEEDEDERDDKEVQKIRLELRRQRQERRRQERQWQQERRSQRQERQEQERQQQLEQERQRREVQGRQRREEQQRGEQLQPREEQEKKPEQERQERLRRKEAEKLEARRRHKEERLEQLRREEEARQQKEERKRLEREKRLEQDRLEKKRRHERLKRQEQERKERQQRQEERRRQQEERKRQQPKEQARMQPQQPKLWSEEVEEEERQHQVTVHRLADERTVGEYEDFPNGPPGLESTEQSYEPADEYHCGDILRELLACRRTGTVSFSIPWRVTLEYDDGDYVRERRWSM